MTRQFCDLCGEPATRYEGVRLEYPKKVLSDKKARVLLSLHITFTHHSSAYTGPPDLCPFCLLGLISALKKKMESKP